MTEPDRPRRGFRATLLRWRAPLVLLPLLLGLGYSGVVGARLLWAEPARDAAPAPVVTCWDGTEATAAACPALTGVAGMRWAFPSFEPGSKRCQRVRFKDIGTPRPLEFRCRTRVEGATAQVHYSERSSLESGLRYFEQRYDGVRPTPTAAGSRLVFRQATPRKDGSYEVAVAYDAYPFAVTVSAANERLRDRVLEESVRFRPERYLLVRPPQRDS